MKKKVLMKISALSCAVASAVVLVACGGANSSGSSGNDISGALSTTPSSGDTVNGDAPIAYVKRSASIGMNPTTAESFSPGGDLLVRDKSSASAAEHNITAGITQGKGDASDPEVSYDGKKIVFAMKCPTSNTSTFTPSGGSAIAACTGHWNIWEYDMTTGGLTGGTLRRLTNSASDDVDPAYLPAGGGFVFSSNRQRTTVVLPSGTHTYAALDEYERETVFNLHTMDANGGNIKQISSNQSHDRNPVVLSTGEIMFARWDHVGGRNHFKVFTVRPDGTNMFVKYGAHSEGNSFLHPREMDPSGQHPGHLSTDLMPLSRSHEGGALVFVDAANFTEQNTPKASTGPQTGGQQQMTQKALSDGTGLSKFGRVTTPFPLWDGTDRVLLAYAPCEVTKNGVVVSCATLSLAELARVSDMERLTTDVNADPVKDNVPPQYGIYMFDSAAQSMRLVAAPPAGFMYTDPIALQARAEPAVIPSATLDPVLAANNQGLIDVRSVYDTDGLGRMGAAVLSPSDLYPGCSTSIPLIAPTADLTHETRSMVPDILSMKDPANPAYRCSPARFVRVVRAVAPSANMMGMRSAIGETDFEPQQLLGYAPIEPDGSFKINVPADTPLGLAVIDSQGRAFQTHTNWIQVRPGEHLSCNGCHRPRGAVAALNSGAVLNTVSAALNAALAHTSGETMADTRTRLDTTLLTPKPDMSFTDVWANTAQAGVVARAPISLRYTGNVDASGNPDPANDLATAVPTLGIINYPDHIQPLWERNRGTNTCTTCHNDPAKLDLRGTIAGTGRTESYERLLVGDPVLDGNGLPKTHIEEGVPVIDRQPALVNTMASEGDAAGMARKSRLIEIMSGQTLLAGAEALASNPNPPGTAPNHATMLNAAEKRLLAEFADLGGKYYNDMYASGVTTVAVLTQASFESTVYPIIRSTCAAGCHQAIGSANLPAGTQFRQNRYVLTGDAEGDFNVTLSMISDVCSPTTSYLLSRPSTVPHPSGAIGQLTAVLPAGSANYTAISNWIQSGCTTP